MNEPVHVSPADLPDFESVKALYKELLNRDQPFSDAEYRAFLHRHNQWIALARTPTAGIVGLVAWTLWEPTLSFPNAVCFVQDEVVAREHRGRGIGSVLLDHVKKWSAERGVRILHLQTDRDENEAALAFYARNGFHVANVGLFYRLDV